MERIRGKIAAILDPTTVVINRGSRDGVSKSDEFYIYSELGPFFDPDTGEEIGTIKTVWGKVTVSNVEERLCLARTEHQMLMDWDWLSGMLGPRLKLPVDESEIEGRPTKIRVGVGTPVILRKRPPVVAEEEVETLPAPSAEEPEESAPLQSEGNALTEGDAGSSLGQ